MSDLLNGKFGFGVMLAAIALVYTVGAFVDVMEVDAAQYASISQEMLQTGEILQVHHRYQDYLDKPPLLFWLSSLSFWLFGVSNFTYKLQHYVFITFPLIAILTGHFMVGIKKNGIWNPIQNVIAGLIIVLISGLSIYSFDSQWWAFPRLLCWF